MPWEQPKKRQKDKKQTNKTNLKIELPNDQTTLFLGMYLKNKTKNKKQQAPQNLIQKDTSTPMFTAVLFTTANWWKQAKCPSTDEWMKKMWHTHTPTKGIQLSHYKRVKCCSKDELGGHYAEWNKSERERHTEWCRMWNLKNTTGSSHCGRVSVVVQWVGDLGLPQLWHRPQLWLMTWFPAWELPHTENAAPPPKDKLMVTSGERKGEGQYRGSGLRCMYTIRYKIS